MRAVGMCWSHPLLNVKYEKRIRILIICTEGTHTHACSVTNHETPTLYNMTSNILKSYRQSSIKLPWNLMQLHMAKIIIYPTFSLQGGGLSAMARDALIEEYYPLRAPEGPAASQVLQPRSSWKERVYKLLGGAVCPIPLYVYLSPQIA